MTTLAGRMAAHAGGAVAAPAEKRLLDYLPAIYHDVPAGEDEAAGADGDAANYLSLFLQAFERLLFDAADGESDEVEPGLERQIAALPALFDPMLTPEEFLPWLASWAAVSLNPLMSLERSRRLVSQIVPLYRMRGTRRYLEAVLALCVDAFVSVSETDTFEFEVGGHATVGLDAYLGGGPPHFFVVNLVAPRLSRRDQEIQLEIARSVIELSKPAHTLYELSLISPEMEIGKHTTVGIDTVLGSGSAED